MEKKQIKKKKKQLISIWISKKKQYVKIQKWNVHHTSNQIEKTHTHIHIKSKWQRHCQKKNISTYHTQVGWISQHDMKSNENDIFNSK